MKPIIKLASAVGADGRLLTLSRRDEDFFIRMDRQELMNSRAHESELELARLGCAALSGFRNPTVLIGGLGMGYTLRQTLDMLRPGAKVVVAELTPEIVQWNKDFLGALNGHPLNDPRVELRIGDVVDIIRNSIGAFDAILLDIDNGPEALTADGNDRLYGSRGIQACCAALREGGCMAVWSAGVDHAFELRLRREGLCYRCCHAPDHKGGKSRTRCIWLASAKPLRLPAS